MAPRLPTIPSVTAQAAEIDPVANHARRLVELQAGVTVEVAGRVARRLQRHHGRCVTLLAAKRRLDLAVARQAVGHLGKVSFGDCVRQMQAPVTGGAGCVGLEMRPDGQMQLVIESEFGVAGGCAAGGGGVTHPAAHAFRKNGAMGKFRAAGRRRLRQRCRHRQRRATRRCPCRKHARSCCRRLPIPAASRPASATTRPAGPTPRACRDPA